MSLRLLASSSPGEVRCALLDADVLTDYAIWRPGAPDGVGDIYRGTVTARVPAMSGSFVALDGSDGFLPDSEAPTKPTVGERLLVRVTRAPQGGKGPRLTARVSEAYPEGMGLLARGPGALLELASRHPNAAVSVDDSALAAELRLRLVARAFDDELEAEIAALAEPVVELPGGARLSINPTPALVAIDVDSGSAAAPLRALNREIIPALARQIRLRGLSGAILVDFAGLSVRRRASLAPALRAALATDPLRPRLLGFTALGLAEIVRPRAHPPLHELLAGPHAAGLAALRELAAACARPPHRLPALRAAPAVVAALQADAAALADLARRAGRGLILRADPTLSANAWMTEPDA
jgi:Ribonuclease G/E